MNETICPACGCTDRYRLNDNRFQCAHCRKKYSERIQRCRLSPETLQQIVQGFWTMTPAQAVAAKQGVNSKTLQKYYDRMRRCLAQLNERSAGEGFGGTCADPALFRELARKKGMGEAVPLFCLACREGKISLLVAEDCGEAFAEVAPEAVVGWIYAHDHKAYAALDLDRIHFLAASPETRNGIEASFWSSAKKGLVKYHGGFRKNFRLFMREMEFRFNARQEQDLQGFLLEMLMTTIETGEEHVQM